MTELESSPKVKPIAAGWSLGILAIPFVYAVITFGIGGSRTSGWDGLADFLMLLFITAVTVAVGLILCLVSKLRNEQSTMNVVALCIHVGIIILVVGTVFLQP